MSSKGHKSGQQNSAAAQASTTSAMAKESRQNADMEIPASQAKSVKELLALAQANTKIPGDFPEIPDIRSDQPLAPALSSPWPEEVDELERGFRQPRGRGTFGSDYTSRGRGYVDVRRGGGRGRYDRDEDSKTRRGGGRYMPPRERLALESEPPGFDEIQWEYIDPSNNIQGPFPASKMQMWMLDNYFPGDLQLRVSGNKGAFIKLQDLLKINGTRPFNKNFDTTAAAIVSSMSGKTDAPPPPSSSVPAAQPRPPVNDVTAALLDLHMFGQTGEPLVARQPEPNAPQPPLIPITAMNEPILRSIMPPQQYAMMTGGRRNDPLLSDPLLAPVQVPQPSPSPYHQAFATDYPPYSNNDWWGNTRQQAWQTTGQAQPQPDAWGAPPPKSIDLAAVLRITNPNAPILSDIYSGYNEPVPQQQQPMARPATEVLGPAETKPVSKEQALKSAEPSAKSKPVDVDVEPIVSVGEIVKVKPSAAEPVPVPVTKTKEQSKPVVKQAEPVAKPVVKQAEPVAKPVVKQAEPVAKPVVKQAEPVAKPVVKQAEPVAKPVVKQAESKQPETPVKKDEGFEQVNNKSAKKKESKKAQVSYTEALYEPMGKAAPTVEMAAPVTSSSSSNAKPAVDPFPRPTFGDHFPIAKEVKKVSLMDVQKEQTQTSNERKKSFAEIQAEELTRRELIKKESEGKKTEAKASAPAPSSLLVATTTTAPVVVPSPSPAVVPSSKSSGQSLKDIMAAQSADASGSVSSVPVTTYSTVITKTTAKPVNKQSQREIKEQQAQAQAAQAQAQAAQAQDEEMFWGSPEKSKSKKEQVSNVKESSGTSKNEDTLQGSFGGPRVPASFVKWAQKELKSITKSEDTTVIEFLVTLQTAQDVTGYLTQLFGNTPGVRGFANDFYINLQSVLSQASEADVPKRKRKTKTVDSRLLGFSSAGDVANLEK